MRGIYYPGVESTIPVWIGLATICTPVRHQSGHWRGPRPGDPYLAFTLPFRRWLGRPIAILGLFRSLDDMRLHTAKTGRAVT